MKRRKFLAAGLALSSGAIISGISSGCGRMSSANEKKRYKSIKTGVLVVGGGPAGIGAAVASAKMGVETLLIESYGFFGGIASGSIGMCINQMRPFGKPRGYVHELLYDKLHNYGDQAVRLAGVHQFFVNVEYLKAAILDALDEVNCNYLVHLKAVDTITDGNRVTGVVVSTKSGLMDIHADVVIDCTGDADVTYFSGAPTLKETDKLSPATLLLNIGNVKNYSPSDMTRENMVRAREKYPLLPTRGWNDMLPVSNCQHFYINFAGTRDLGVFDITDPYQFSDAECKSRRQIIQLTEAMREYGTGDMKNCEIVGASPQIQIRESRRIQGEYVLSEDDAFEGKKFDDAIAWRSGLLDVGFVSLARMKVHQVPYRCLVPEGMDGLLAAGRCISTTHLGLSAGKSMGNCFATGHAAGVAAALAKQTGKQPREVNVAEIQKILTSDGVDLTMGGEEQPRDMAF